MAIKYANILHSKALQNIPKSRFLVSKYTSWQPCSIPRTRFDLAANTYVPKRSRQCSTTFTYLIVCAVPTAYLSSEHLDFDIATC
jgi:hypothetical protein